MGVALPTPDATNVWRAVLVLVARAKQISANSTVPPSILPPEISHYRQSLSSNMLADATT